MRIISWDIAKYVNHCCQCNTMSTGYDFEIAIEDIQPGVEITDEYGMFNFTQELTLSCDKEQCRGKVSGRDLEQYYEEWDQQVKAAIQLYSAVDQPLEHLLSEKIKSELSTLVETGKGYRSVLELKSTSGWSD